MRSNYVEVRELISVLHKASVLLFLVDTGSFLAGGYPLRSSTNNRYCRNGVQVGCSAIMPDWTLLLVCGDPF